MFGIKVNNTEGTIIIGEDIVPILALSEFRSINKTHSRYRLPNISGRIAAFEMLQEISWFSIQGSSPNDLGYSIASPYLLDTNYSGVINFRLIATGPDAIMPPTGYGISIRNSEGAETFNSNVPIASSNNLRAIHEGDVIALPDGSFVAILAWRHVQGISAPSPSRAVLTRVANTDQFEVSISGMPGSGLFAGLILLV